MPRPGLPCIFMLVLFALASVDANIGRGISDAIRKRPGQQQPEEDDGDQVRTVYACEGSTLTLECKPGRVINIKRANYGRFKVDMCNTGQPTGDWSMQCMSVRSIEIVSNLCHRKSDCDVEVSAEVFPEDPCPGTEKYLEVEYFCINASAIASTARPTRRPQPPRTRPPPPTTTTTTTTTTTQPPITCPPTQVYNECGSICNKTCIVPNPVCIEVCRERCECPTGAPIWHNGFCISEDQCASQPVKKCPLGQVWNDCGSPCTKTCDTQQTVCATVCTARCECPRSRPILHKGQCVTRSSCPRSQVTDRPKIEKPTVCIRTERRNITWPTTDAGQIAEQPCPNRPEEVARWRCTRRGWTRQPDMGRCKSRAVGNLEVKAMEAKRVLRELKSLALDVEHPPSEEAIREKELAALQIVEDVTHDLVDCSAQPMASTFGGDVDGITWAMQEIVDEVQVQVHDIPASDNTKRIVEKVSQAVVESSNNMLDGEKQESWLDLPQATQAQAATRVIHSVESSAFELARTLDKPTERIQVQLNLVLEVNVLDVEATNEDVSFSTKKDAYKGSAWQNNSNSLTLSAASIKQMGVNGLAKVIFSTYKNIEQYLAANIQSDQPAVDGEEYDGIDYNLLDDSDKQDLGMSKDETEMAEKIMNETFVNTQVIAASINGRHDNMPLAEPVYYTLQHNEQKNIYKPTCAFWEYSEWSMGTGQWSTFGCLVHKTNMTHTVCKCEHLTNFAVLMDVSATPLEEHHALALSFITYVGCIVSLICLLLAWLTFQFVESLQCDRNTIHKNLVFCLFMAEIIFLAGIGQADKPTLCSVVAGFLHYFFLAAFTWMCLEGLQLYFMLVEVFEAERSRILGYYLAGYGIPAIIVSITAGVRPSGYGTDVYCWLSVDNGVIWAFVGPVIFVMLLNTIMLGVAIYMMCKHAKASAAWKMKQKTRSENIRSWVKGTFVLVVLLGLTWMLGFMYVNQATVFMAYIFTFLNTLQGVFIYFFHCIFNDKVQKEYKRIARKSKCLPECVRVKYGGARSSSGSTPQSTSGNPFQRLLSSRFRKRSSTTSLPKTSSSTPGQYHDMQHNRNSTTHEQAVLMNNESSNAPDSAFYSEIHEEGYLEPQKCAQQHSAFDVDDTVRDFSIIEGSICDTDYFDQICSPSNKTSPVSPMAIDVDKYKIKGQGTLPPHKPPVPMAERRLPAIPQEECLDEDEDDRPQNEYASIPAKRIHSPNRNAYGPVTEMETLPIRKDMDVESELDLIVDDSDDDSVKKRPLSSDSGNQSPSLNDLNKLDLSSLSSAEDADERIRLNEPNIAFKGKGSSSKPEPFYFDYGSRDEMVSRNSSDTSLRSTENNAPKPQPRPAPIVTDI